MALLDNQTQAQYYGNSDNFGKYQFTSLQDVINQQVAAPIDLSDDDGWAL